VLWNGDKLKIWTNPAFLFFVGLLCAIIISGITPWMDGNQKMIIQYIKTALHFIFMGFVVFIAMSYPIKTRIWTQVIQMLLIISIFINLFGVYQIIARAYNLPFAWIPITNVSFTSRGLTDISEVGQLSLNFGSFFRATSIFSEPSALAGFNLIIIIFVLIPWVQKQNSFFKSKALNITIFVIAIIGLFLAFSLTGYFGFAILIITILVFEKSKRIFSLIKILSLMLVLLVIVDSIVYYYSDESVFRLIEQRVGFIFSSKGSNKESILGESYVGRSQTFKKILLVWEDNPIVGQGLGLTIYNKKQDIMYSDSSVFTALAEMGIIGFISFVGFLITILIVSGKYLLKRKEHSELSADTRRITGIVFYQMVFILVGNTLSGNNLIFHGLWFPLMMFISILHSADIELGKSFYEVQILKEPLKISLGRAIGKYLEIAKSKKSMSK
jgi:O-antigen ligase